MGFPMAKGLASNKAIGLEFDQTGIRATGITGTSNHLLSVWPIFELKGDFSQEAQLLEGLKQLKQQLPILKTDKVVTAVGGKQVFVAQMPFRKLPESELEGALKLEVRKFVHFEMAASTFEYQILKGHEEHSDQIQVMVSVVSNAYLLKQVHLLEKAGIKPNIVDVLPLALANVLPLHKSKVTEKASSTIIHFAPGIATIVIEAPGHPFFHRYLYFSLENLQGSKNTRDLCISGLSDEINRSLSYYEKNHAIPGGLHDMIAIGDYLHLPGFLSDLRKATGLEIRVGDLANSTQSNLEVETGRLELAIALALRALP